MGDSNPTIDRLYEVITSRRRADHLVMQNAMRGFKLLFERQELPVRWLRNSGLRLVDGAVPLKRELIRQAMGVAR